ncbi:MAG: hypothetical protein WCO19_01965 [Candidatus Saccharibacteria bacterium]
MTENTQNTAAAVNLDSDLDDEAIAKGLASGERTTGGFDGPSWVPTLAAVHNPDLKPEALAVKVGKAGPGSTTRAKLAGVLVAAMAWGRRIYFVDVTAKDGRKARVKLPESKVLYAGLNLCKLGATVALGYDGRGKPKKPGQQPPHLYTVASVDHAMLPAPRADSLRAESMDEREARQKREAAKRDAEQRGEPGGDDDADLPF